MKHMELRMSTSEIRTNEDGSLYVSGYVNKTGQLSNVLGNAKRFVEKISPGAFQRAINNADHDIHFLAEHNDKLILASTRNDSLKLREDGEGLFMEAIITPTSWGKDYYELISSGILQNMSFGFRNLKDSWKSRTDRIYERTIEELSLYEISVVNEPAYAQSTIAARGIDVVEDVEIPDEIKEENRSMEKADEILGKLNSLEERFNDFINELKETRSEENEDQEKHSEKTEEEKLPEESTTESEKEEEVEEIKEETKEPETEEVEEKEATEDEESSKENAEDSEDSDEEDEEEVRSEKPNFLEFRSKLDLLKQEEK